MKKFLISLILFLFLLFVPYANAEIVFYNANQVTLSWDAVTTDIDGDPVTGITYKLYLANANTDPDKTNPVVVAEITDTQETITLSKGRYYVGVQTCLDDLSSIINWGDELEGQEGCELFGLRFAVPPHPAKKLRK